MFSSPTLSTDTTLADAREGYAYWRDRASELAWHRRSARREARAMAARWRARLVRAHLERFGLGATAILLEPVIGLAGLSRRDHARWLWRTVGRRTPLASRKLWLGVAVATVATGVTAVVVVHALWGLLLA